MTALPVEINIRVKCGDVSQEIREDIQISDVMAGIIKVGKGFQQTIATAVLEVTEQSIHAQIPESSVSIGC